MNIQIWRHDKEVMLYVNPIADRLLDSMDGSTVFSEIVEQAYESNIEQLRGSKTLDLVNFSKLAEYGDRSINSVSFTMALWAKGFIDFIYNHENIEDVTLSPTIKLLLKENQAFTSKNVLIQLFEQYPDDLSRVLRTFQQEQGVMMGLLLNDKLMAFSTGDKEIADEPSSLPDTPAPQFEYGYIKPAILEKYESSFAKVGTIAACGAAIVAIVGGTLVAFYVGDKTISQECGTGDDSGDGSNDDSNDDEQPGSGNNSGGGNG